MDALNDNDDFRGRPRRPCFVAVDQRGRIRCRYRYAKLALLETTENGWELRMEGHENDPTSEH